MRTVSRFAACCGALAAAAAAGAPVTCPPPDFATTTGFDLDTFVSAPWFIHQQMEVSYLPKSQNRCVRAVYERKSKKSFWGYEIGVRNFAEDVAIPHTKRDSGSTLCAKVVDADSGKLKVAPCAIPPLLGGPYWVLDYDEEQGYALISGGPPKIVGEGGCRTGTGVNGSGLWIFTRSQDRDQKLIDRVRAIAAKKGFDLSVLNDVDQTDCGAAEIVQV